VKKMPKKRRKAGKRKGELTEESLCRRCGEIVSLTDEFCNAHLDKDYRELCREMVDELCMGGFPLDRGRAASWAAGIVHALGWVNFLHDPSMSPYMTSAQVAEGFGISQGTMMAKSRAVRDELDLVQLDPDWCTEAMLEDNARDAGRGVSDGADTLYSGGQARTEIQIRRNYKYNRVSRPTA